MCVVIQLGTRNISAEVNTKASGCLESLGFSNQAPTAWIGSSESFEDHPEKTEFFVCSNLFQADYLLKIHLLTLAKDS